MKDRSLKIEIPVKPLPVQSTRHCIRWKYNEVGRKVPYLGSYTSKRVREYKNFLCNTAKAQLPNGFSLLTGPLWVVCCTFHFKPITSFRKSDHARLEYRGFLYKTTGADVTDNLQKGLWDAMEGVIFENDKQICRVSDIERLYDPEFEGIRFEIRELPEDLCK